MERRRRLRSTGRGLTLNRTAFSFFSWFPHLFFPVISLASRTARLEPSARARRAPTHFLSSFPATTKRLREQLASLRARATGRCLRGLRSSKCIQSPLPDSTHASYPRRKPFGLAQGLSLDLRSILSPFASFGISSVRPALFTSRPQKPGLPVAHASVTFCNTRHRLSLSFGHVKPNGLTLPARRPVVLNGSKLRLSPLARAPGAQKPREKLLTFQRHSVDFPTTKHQPLCSAITINTS